MTISRMQEPRQLYGLGSLVKKITKPIKKVIKSPIGKAALAGAAIYFGGGGGNPFTAAGRSQFGSNVFGKFLKDSVLGGFQPIKGGASSIREGGLLGLLKKGFSGAASGFGNLSTGQKAFLLGGAGLSLLPFFTAAEGGIADLPKVRMLEGGVPEIDYRQSGGFVPMGKKEKADDVPAMLSKNEFVMTADAVRGMGDGNVEKGAQKMYDQMRQLENRVA